MGFLIRVKSWGEFDYVSHQTIFADRNNLTLALAATRDFLKKQAADGQYDMEGMELISAEEFRTETYGSSLPTILSYMGVETI
jgi:hypothetical protein